MSKCEYCNKKFNYLRKETKEHIFPTSFYKSLGLKDVKYKSYNPKNGKVKCEEYKISKVCSCCNNDYLSKLDNYVNENILEHCYKNTNFAIKYNYDILTRWLLKTTYNATIFASLTTTPYIQLIDYILFSKKNKNTNIKVFSFSICGDNDKVNFMSIGEILINFNPDCIHISKYIQILNQVFIIIVFDKQCQSNQDLFKRIKEYLRKKYNADLLSKQNNILAIKQKNIKVSYKDIFNTNLNIEHLNMAYIFRISWGEIPENIEKNELSTKNYPINKFTILTIQLKDNIIPVVVFNECTTKKFCKEILIEEYEKAIDFTDGFAEITRTEFKTLITIKDVNNKDSPWFLDDTGTIQNIKNWMIFKNAVINNGCMYLSKIITENKDISEQLHSNHWGNIRITSKVKVHWNT